MFESEGETISASTSSSIKLALKAAAKEKYDELLHSGSSTTAEVSGIIASRHFPEDKQKIAGAFKIARDGHKAEAVELANRLEEDDNPSRVILSLAIQAYTDAFRLTLKLKDNESAKQLSDARFGLQIKYHEFSESNSEKAVLKVADQVEKELFKKLLRGD